MNNVKDCQPILMKIKDNYIEILQDNLVGIYIHGSIAFNCFNWDKSDIDFIVVVNEPLSVETKLKLMDATIDINQSAPANGLEMSVVLKEYCLDFLYPTPFELHFSNAHIDWYKNTPNNYCQKMNGEDKDLAAHFTVINKLGIVLHGADTDSVFAQVPRKHYSESIKGDIESATEDILGNPIYIILNLCRVLAFLQDSLVLSKEQGGKWGIEHLESAYKELITEAVDCYITDREIEIDKDTSLNFSNYMLGKIFEA